MEVLSWVDPNRKPGNDYPDGQQGNNLFWQTPRKNRSILYSAVLGFIH